MKFPLRYRPVALLAVFLFLILPVVADAQSADTPSVDPSVEIKFGESIEFFAIINSEVTAVRAALFLRSSSAAQFEVFLVGIEPGEPNKAAKRFTPQAINLRPFEQFEYYWQVDFTNGSVLTHEPVRMTYLDDRFPWQELSRETLTIRWVEGDVDWAQEIYALIADVLPEIQNQLATSLAGPINLYIYPGQSDLQNSLRLAGVNQASAHALPELGVILVAGEKGPETLIRFEQDIPHELVHLVLYGRMGASVANLPMWLNEGLATRFEQAPRQIFSLALEQAANQDTLLEMEALCSNFPIAETDRVLAYAQSASFIDYLYDVYGSGGIVQLLDAYQEGTSCTGGVQRVYQRSLDQLEAEWTRVEFGNRPSARQMRIGLYAFLGVVFISLLLITTLILRRQRKHRPSDDTRKEL